MKNSILNLGKALNKAAQKEILGGAPQPTYCQNPCSNKDCVGYHECMTKW